LTVVLLSGWTRKILETNQQTADSICRKIASKSALADDRVARNKWLIYPNHVPRWHKAKLNADVADSYNPTDYQIQSEEASKWIESIFSNQRQGVISYAARINALPCNPWPVESRTPWCSWCLLMVQGMIIVMPVYSTIYSAVYHQVSTTLSVVFRSIKWETTILGLKEPPQRYKTVEILTLSHRKEKQRYQAQESHRSDIRLSRYWL